MKRISVLFLLPSAFSLNAAEVVGKLHRSPSLTNLTVLSQSFGTVSSQEELEIDNVIQNINNFAQKCNTVEDEERSAHFADVLMVLRKKELSDVAKHSILNAVGNYDCRCLDQFGDFLVRHNSTGYAKQLKQRRMFALAAQRDDADTIKELIKLGMTSDIKMGGKTVLEIAQYAKSAKAYHALCWNAPSLNVTPTKVEIVDSPTTAMKKVFFHAVEAGDTAMIEAFTGLNTQLLKERDQGQTALQVAEKNRSALTIKCLIGLGAADSESDEERPGCIPIPGAVTAPKTSPLPMPRVQHRRQPSELSQPI